MRELLFELDYASGWNQLADTLADYPETVVRSLSCHVTADRLWRVDRVEGTAAALDAVEAAYEAAEYFPDCLVSGDCEATATVRVLDRTDGASVIYCRWDRSAVCSSVPHLALEHLGEGILFETLQRGRHQQWRLVLPDDADVPKFTDALRSEVEDLGGMELLRLTDHTPAPGDDRTGGEPVLPPEQQRALRAAVKHGYYAVPRETDLSSLADLLEVPRSTLSYRLRNAEAAMADAFLADARSPDAGSR